MEKDTSTVYVQTGNSTGKYHTDPDCRTLPAKTRSLARYEAEAFEWAECKYCSGEVAEKKEYEPSLRSMV